MVKLDEALGRSYVLLGDGVNPKSFLTDEEVEGWQQLGSRFITLRQRAQSTDTTEEIVDIHEQVIRWMRKFGVQVIAVRPDRFVAAADTSGLAVPDWPATRDLSIMA